MGLFSRRSADRPGAEEKRLEKEAKLAAKREAEQKEIEKMHAMPLKEQFSYTMRKPETIGFVIVGIIGLALIILKIIGVF